MSKIRFFIFIVLAIACISASAATLEDKYATLAGVKIRYIDVGKGEPIVLLHGGTSSLDSWITTGVVANLSKDYRVIAYDARGAGKSDKPHEASAYGKEQARDVPRLLDALKIQRAHIVGFSLGGSTTSLLLTMHPERFLTATLVAGPGRFPWTAKDQQRVETEATEIAKDCVSRSRIWRQAPVNNKPTEEDFQKRVADCRANRDFDPLSTAASIRSYGDQAITDDQIRPVKVPTLVIVGDLDHALAGSQHYKKLRPDATLVILPGVSHTGATGIQRQPALVSEIREFVSKNGTAQ